MELQEPLLPSEQQDCRVAAAAGMSSSSWPSEEAARAKLYIPPTWPGGKDDDDNATCMLSYDSDVELFKTVNQQDDTVLDMFSPRDVIGADLEIKLFGPEDDAQERRVGFRNAAAAAPVVEEDDDDDGIVAEKSTVAAKKKGDSTCDIFAPLGKNMDKIFSYKKMNHDSNTNALEQIPYDTQATAFLNIYCYPRKDPKSESWMTWCGLSKSIPGPNPNPPSGDGHRYAHHRRLEVVPSQDFADIRTVARAIRLVSGQETPAGRKFIVLVNPKAGTGTAEKVFESVVKPMLEQACIDYDVHVTTNPGDAEEYMKHKENLLDYDAYICLGGDGVIHEAIQGIKMRPDDEQVRKKLKLGIIGCGSGNGLAKSITHASEEKCTHLESTFVICKGETSMMDLSVYNVGDKTYTSFLTFTWAMIADVDIESEKIRCLGSTRFDIWAAWRTVKLRKYRAKLSYLLPGQSRANIIDLPALTEPVPSDWTTIEADFILLWASQVTHANETSYHSPPSRMQDGVFQILIIRAPASRYRIARLLLALETGRHVDSPIAEFIECVAYRLEPITQGSFNDLDGEVIESGPIQAKVLPAAMQVFCKPQQS